MTKFYLRVTTANTTAYGNSEWSTALPVGTVQTPSSGGGLHDLSTTAGTSQTSTVFTTLAQTAHQDGKYVGKFISDPLTVSSVSANTWTLAFACSTSNANANPFFVGSIYVLKADDTVRGFVYDSDTALGSVWSTAEQGRVFTVSGSSVAGVISTDRLAIEVWYHAVQIMATAYTNTVFYDGTTDPTDTTATSNAASYISTPEDLFAAGAAAADPYVHRRGPNYRR